MVEGMVWWGSSERGRGKGGGRARCWFRRGGEGILEEGRKVGMRKGGVGEGKRMGW